MSQCDNRVVIKLPTMTLIEGLDIMKITPQTFREHCSRQAVAKTGEILTKVFTDQTCRSLTVGLRGYES